jgi:hypothetical protein
MTDFVIGAHMTEDGAEFFGTDALNAQLILGARVTQITPGETLIEEVEGEEGAYAVAGFELVVTLADAPA